MKLNKLYRYTGKNPEEELKNLDWELRNLFNKIGGTTASMVGAPDLVSPAVVDNFVSFADIGGGQKDSGNKAADFVPKTTTVNSKALSGNITLGLASSDFANQGTTTTVLHGNASGNPAFGAVVEADITLADNTTNNVSNSAHGLQAKDAFALVGLQILTVGSGTYTPTSGTRAARVIVIGAGGGGGGAAYDTAKIGVATGGGGGGRCEKFITSLAANYAYTVGAGGSGGAAGQNYGTAGADSTFGTGGSILTASGGARGIQGVASTAPAITGPSAATTSTSGGDINVQSNQSTRGFSLSATLGIGTPGGISNYGNYGAGGGSVGGDGVSATGYGAGGGGAVACASTNHAGGNGSDGVIIVYEYK